MSVPEPYWRSEDGDVVLYLGDCREVLPALGVTADCIIADPPYAETSLAWDRWPDGWVEIAARTSRSMWCFGSLRMFGERWGEFAAAKWKLSHDVECEWVDHAVWEKPKGAGLLDDRFRRVHEIAAHWYRGPWGEIHHPSPRESYAGPVKNHRAPTSAPDHTSRRRLAAGYEDDGTRLIHSVIRVAGLWKRGAIHPTEKPVGILDPLISYACPGGGLVVDPFAGSGSTLDAARASGRRALGVEADERYIERAARRLSQMVLEAS